MFRQHQSSLGWIAPLRCLVVEELALPNLLLGLPVHDKALLDWSSKHNLPEVLTLFELGSHVRLSVSIPCYTVGYDAWLVNSRVVVIVVVVVVDETSFDRIGSIVENQGPSRRRRLLDLGLPWGHDHCDFLPLSLFECLVSIIFLNAVRYRIRHIVIRLRT